MQAEKFPGIWSKGLLLFFVVFLASPVCAEETQLQDKFINENSTRLDRLKGVWKAKATGIELDILPIGASVFIFTANQKTSGVGYEVYGMPNKYVFEFGGLSGEFSLSNSSNKMMGWFRKKDTRETFDDSLEKS